MSIDVSDWSARKKLKYSLLRRAVKQNRGGQVILLMQWRLALERHKNKDGIEEAQDFEAENAGQPRSLRALNLISKNMGLSTVYKDTAPISEGKSNYYIKPGFLDRDFDRAVREKDSLPIVSSLNKIAAADQLALSLTRLHGMLHDETADHIVLRSIALQARHDRALEDFKRTGVASHDGINRVELAEKQAAMKKAAYDDNEDAMDADIYVMKIIENYFDDDPENDTAPDELLTMAGHNQAFKLN